MRLFRSSIVTSGCVLLALLMAACGGGGGGKSAATSSQTPGGETGASNAAPTITGKPGGSILPGQAYSFQPSASDPDGDALEFSVTNLPDWAGFDSATGRLTGTPTSADVATYEGITIEVTDGEQSATIGPFAITVTQVGSGTATLSWVPPTENSDGSTLTDLAGYQVLYGQDAENLDQVATLTNPSLSSYVIDNLTTGTWFFAVVAVNSDGETSPLSNLASKAIG